MMPSRIEFELAPEDQKDHQHGHPLQHLLHQRGDDRPGGNIRGDLRLGELENAQPQEGVYDEGAAGRDHRPPQKDTPQQQQGFLLVAVEPVENISEE